MNSLMIVQSLGFSGEVFFFIIQNSFKMEKSIGENFQEFLINYLNLIYIIIFI